VKHALVLLALPEFRNVAHTTSYASKSWAPRNIFFLTLS